MIYLDHHASALLSPHAAGGGGGPFVVHPALLDACFQVLGAACAARNRFAMNDPLHQPGRGRTLYLLRLE